MYDEINIKYIIYYNTFFFFKIINYLRNSLINEYKNIVN